ncbi:hypothetical protein [Jannaschia ovalis]|uniref:Uncharacterized protein n=1 Tax=Jannaschia ovalis TaxID=3038773 RepID=A0ABY8L7Q4_9RHOB|nr:hypothetical protein [Jannaschia sp. GRR-S6-38]WGH77409.1 hypothetical protein P8627_10150 [Jannaschia sp. GRR-S6-38]
MLAISALLWALALWLVARAPRGWARLWAALGAFWAFVWLSPQVYYLFYIAHFDGLPWQVVTGPPPAPGRLLRLLAFAQEASLSRHGQGVLGWSLLALAALSWRSPSRGASP